MPKLTAAVVSGKYFYFLNFVNEFIFALEFLYVFKIIFCKYNYVCVCVLIRKLI